MDNAVERPARYPVVIFVLLSTLFGPLLITATPPMRGPDEPAHFIRAYGLSQGQIIPSLTDSEGRKGIFIPLRLQREMEVFEFARYHVGEPDFSYRQVFADYARVRAEWSAGNDGAAEVFSLYGGSEGYSPAPYLAYLPAVAAARLLGLDFLSTFYLMRAAGFVATTAIMACAIVFAPCLRWAFLLIAMLPSALYARAVLSADGSSLAFALLVAALYLRSVGSVELARPWIVSLCLALCALCKPPQIVFIMLEAMRTPLRKLPRYWRSLLVVLPAVILPAVWAQVSSADMATWRNAAGAEFPPGYFDPLWRLRFMLEHPWHFPHMLAGALHSIADYWRQLIGVLAWLDEPLHPIAYPIISVLLLAAFCEPLDRTFQTRMRIAAFCAATALSYCLAVFLIFYLVWTRFDADQVQGVQGRYFVIVLPLVAMTVSALVNRGLPVRARAGAAVLGAILSAASTLEAVLRVDWRLALFLL